MSNEQKTDQTNKKTPLEQVLGQLKESASKASQAVLKGAMEEFIKAREVYAKTEQKLLEAIEATEEADTTFAEIKSELKNKLK